MKKLIIPFILGDGIGQDITPVMQRAVNTAIETTYGAEALPQWVEALMGEKAQQQYGALLPPQTIDLIKKHGVAIKGPLATPIGGGMRSLNVALRQTLELFMCVRPVTYVPGCPSPLKHPEHVDMTIFRENSEDIYAGIEWPAGSKEAQNLIHFLENNLASKKIQNPLECAIGIKPISKPASQKIACKAIAHAIENKKQFVTIVHKGNIMKFTEGGFKNWCYEVATEDFNAKLNNQNQYQIDAPHGCVIIKDCIADAFLQEILLHPKQHQVIVTMNLNGDYISDALAAQVGGIGIAPGANLSETCGVFEATHGTAPAIAGKNIANPCSILLSAVMMLEYLQMPKAAQALQHSVHQTIANKTVTQDFYAHMQNATLLSTTEFGDAVVNNMS